MSDETISAELTQTPAACSDEFFVPILILSTPYMPDQVFTADQILAGATPREVVNAADR